MAPPNTRSTGACLDETDFMRYALGKETAKDQDAYHRHQHRHRKQSRQWRQSQKPVSNSCVRTRAIAVQTRGCQAQIGAKSFSTANCKASQSSSWRRFFCEHRSLARQPDSPPGCIPGSPIQPVLMALVRPVACIQRGDRRKPCCHCSQTARQTHAGRSGRLRVLGGLGDEIAG